MYNKGLLAAPQRVRTGIVKKKRWTLSVPPFTQFGGSTKRNFAWVRNMKTYCQKCALGTWQSRWTMRIRGGLFTRAPECRLNGLEMDLSQIRAVARELKRERLGRRSRGEGFLWGVQNQIGLHFQTWISRVSLTVKITLQSSFLYYLTQSWLCESPEILSKNPLLCSYI